MTKVELDIFQSKQLVLYSIKVTAHEKLLQTFALNQSQAMRQTCVQKSLNKSLFSTNKGGVEY